MVIDYRKINEDTDQDAYPLPVIDDILDQLGKAKFFSAFDLSAGFHQIPMKESDKKYTAFSTSQGHFEYNRMPFGLKNKPQKRKQKGKDNDNLEQDVNAIDSDYEFNKDPLIKENTDLDSFSDESDILTEDNSLQYKNQHLENTEERIHENFNDDLYSQNENIASEDLENRPPPEHPPLKKTCRL